MGGGRDRKGVVSLTAGARRTKAMIDAVACLVASSLAGDRAGGHADDHGRRDVFSWPCFSRGAADRQVSANGGGGPNERRSQRTAVLRIAVCGERLG
jgi:hypothetical protein